MKAFHPVFGYQGKFWHQNNKFGLARKKGKDEMMGFGENL